MRPGSDFVRRGNLEALAVLLAEQLVGLFVVPVHAGELLGYVGPGAGLTMIGALLAVIAVIFVGLLGPILYPIRMFRRWYCRRNEAKTQTETAATDAPTQ